MMEVLTLSSRKTSTCPGLFSRALTWPLSLSCVGALAGLESGCAVLGCRAWRLVSVVRLSGRFV